MNEKNKISKIKYVLSTKEKIGFLSFIVNLFLCISKLIVGIISNSAAIIAEGINSATDIAASFICYIGIKTSKKPKDKEHPYGYHKTEIIAGFLITIILILTSVYIIYNGINNFFYCHDNLCSIKYNNVQNKNYLWKKI